MANYLRQFACRIGFELERRENALVRLSQVDAQLRYERRSMRACPTMAVRSKAIGALADAPPRRPPARRVVAAALVDVFVSATQPVGSRVRQDVAVTVRERALFSDLVNERVREPESRLRGVPRSSGCGNDVYWSQCQAGKSIRHG